MMQGKRWKWSYSDDSNCFAESQVYCGRDSCKLRDAQALKCYVDILCQNLKAMPDLHANVLKGSVSGTQAISRKERCDKLNDLRSRRELYACLVNIILIT